VAAVLSRGRFDRGDDHCRRSRRRRPISTLTSEGLAIDQQPEYWKTNTARRTSGTGQIAKELSASHAVQLAVGSHQTPLPQKLFGRDIFWWLTKLGMLNTTVDSRLGRRLRDRDTIIGSSPRQLERKYGVALRPRVVGASGRTIRFADGNEQEFDAVVWATGFEPDHAWIHLPVRAADGRLRHRRGVTDVPGLYFLGLAWQHTRGSALLGWVKDDAEFLAAKIDAGAPRRVAATVKGRQPGATNAPQLADARERA
jgi:hypothetical protein